MKTIFLFITLLLFSCGTAKNTDAIMTNQTKGKVIISDNCVTIQASVDDKVLRFYPVNLNDEFKKENLEILFDYSPSKAQQPTNCSIDMVVTVREVSIVKK